jgi:hypothetical protein
MEVWYEERALYARALPVAGSVVGMHCSSRARLTFLPVEGLIPEEPPAGAWAVGGLALRLECAA